MIPGLIALGVLVVLILAIVAIYNRLVRLRNRVEESWAQIDVQLRRRHDLIPNLVETVKGYAAHEKGVFEEVTRARAAAVAAGGVQEQAQAELGLTRALRSLFAVAEAYPDLQASPNFLELQEELTATEDRISSARQFYNGAVRSYDDARETFPSNIVAGMFNFEEREYFEVDDPEIRDPVKVEF
ncbi:MAG: LemA family protein [Actinobacteria bacterium]|nr:LemA family protein [Actinomycetota bacterium]